MEKEANLPSTLKSSPHSVATPKAHTVVSHASCPKKKPALYPSLLLSARLIDRDWLDPTLSWVDILAGSEVF